MRKQASNDFEKNFYKLMSNACFGKTMENIRRRGNMRFVTTEAQAETIVQRATFKNFKIISDALVSILEQAYARGSNYVRSFKAVFV